MYCKKCGVELPDNTEICSNCGTVLRKDKISDDVASKIGQISGENSQDAGNRTVNIEEAGKDEQSDCDKEEKTYSTHDDGELPKKTYTAPELTNTDKILMNIRESIWCKLAAISCGCGIITFLIGLYKLLFYENTDYNLVNAYVGGDAYNYIINTGYATACFVLSSMFILSAIGLIIVHYIRNK